MASKLEALAAAQPVANQRRAQQKRATRDFQLQQAIGKVPTGTSSSSTAQALGGEIAKQAGTDQVADATSTVQQGAQLGQADLQDRSSDLANRVTGLKQGLQSRNMEQDQQVFAKAQQLENEAFSARMSFKKDELGRLEANDRQLADYAVASGVSDEKLRDFAQTSQLAYQRDIQLMEQASKVLQANIEFESKKAEQDKDQDLLSHLADLKKANDEKIQRQKAEADKNAQIWNTVLTIGVAAASAYAGS